MGARPSPPRCAAPRVLRRACEGARFALETLQMQSSGRFSTLSSRAEELEMGAAQHACEVDAQLAQLASDVGEMLAAADRALARSQDECDALRARNEALEHDNRVLRGALNRYEEPPEPTPPRPSPRRLLEGAGGAAAVGARGKAAAVPAPAPAVEAGAAMVELRALRDEVAALRAAGTAAVHAPSPSPLRPLARSPARVAAQVALSVSPMSPEAAAAAAAATERGSALRSKVEATVRAAIEERLSVLGATSGPPPPPPVLSAPAAAPAAAAPMAAAVHLTPAPDLQPTALRFETAYVAPQQGAPPSASGGFDANPLLAAMVGAGTAGSSGGAGGRASVEGDEGGEAAAAAGGSSGGGFHGNPLLAAMGGSNAGSNAAGSATFGSPVERTPAAPVASAAVVPQVATPAPAAASSGVKISSVKRKELMARLAAAKKDRQRAAERKSPKGTAS